MPNPRLFQIGYTPEYWDYPDPTEKLFRYLAKHPCRKKVEELFRDGRIEPIADWLRHAELPAELAAEVARGFHRLDLPAHATSLRDQLTHLALHLQVNGWEPLYDEQEIARIALSSANHLEDSVRARRSEGVIVYRVITDDCDERGARESDQPLSFGEMIELLDGGYCEEGAPGLVESVWQRALLEGEGELDAVRDCVRVESDYYPELSAWYEAAFEEWLERVTEEGTPWTNAAEEQESFE